MAEFESCIDQIVVQAEDITHIASFVLPAFSDLPHRKKMAFCRLTCRKLFNHSMALRLTDNDVPSVEAGSLRNQFIVHGIYAFQLIDEYRTKYESADSEEGRQAVADEFFQEVREVLDDVIPLHSKLYDEVKDYH